MHKIGIEYEILKTIIIILLSTKFFFFWGGGGEMGVSFKDYLNVFF